MVSGGGVDWAVLADLPGHSRIAIFADPERFDIGYGADSWDFLKHAGLLDAQTPFPRTSRAGGPDADVLPDLPDGWKRIGLVTTLGRPRAMPLPGGRVAMVGGLPWCLLFDWAGDQPAWETLLTTQEQIQPDQLSLPPWLTIMMLFLSRMADRAQSSMGAAGEPPGRWLDLLPAVLTSAHPLTQALFTTWLNGTSAAATRYRERRAIRAPVPFARTEQDAVQALQRLFDSTWVEALAVADRPEPLVLRCLDETSAQLWIAGSAAVRAGLPKPPSALLGLLAIGRWAASAPALPVPRSMSDCLRQWQQWARSTTEARP